MANWAAFLFPDPLVEKLEGNMADEPTLTEPVAEPGTPEPTPAVAVNTETPKADAHMIPKTRFDEVNKELRQLKAQLDRAAKDREAAEQAALAEQGKYRELYEKEKAEREAALKRALELEHNDLRRQVATAAGHPNLWSRINGETKDELEADMKALMDAMPRPQAPDLNGGAGAGSRGSQSQLTDSQLREMAAVYGVSYEHLKQQYS